MHHISHFVASSLPCPLTDATQGQEKSEVPMVETSSRGCAVLAGIVASQEKRPTLNAVKKECIESRNAHREPVSLHNLRLLQGGTRLTQTSLDDNNGERNEMRLLQRKVVGKASRKLSRCCARESVLQGKLKLAELVSRLEKGELGRILKEEIDYRRETAKKIHEEAFTRRLLEHREQQKAQGSHEHERKIAAKQVASENEASVLTMKKGDKSWQVNCNEENESLRQEVESLKQQYKLDMRRWNIIRSENEQLKESLESSSSKSREEIHQLREDLFWALESQKQLKSELSELEASHAKELEMAHLDVSEENARLNERLDRQGKNAREEKEAHQIEVCKLSDELLRIQNSQQQIELQCCQLKTLHAKELENLTTKKHVDFQKDVEIAHLKDIIKNQADYIHTEKERIRLQLRAHLKEVQNLKKDFVQEQVSHKKDLSHILGRLEAVEMHRDDQVAYLAEQFEVLKLNTNESFHGRSSRLSVIEENLNIHPRENSRVSSCPRPKLKQPFEKTCSSNTFAGTLKRLQRAVKPENMTYILGKIEGKHDADIEAKVFGEIYIMTLSLGEMYYADTTGSY